MTDVPPTDATAPAPAPAGWLAGKAALVVGSGPDGPTAVARATAHTLAAQGAGVLLADPRPVHPAWVTHQGATVHIESGHTADPAAAEALVEGCRSRFGRLDVLVTDVHRGLVTGDAMATSLDDWRAVLDANVTAVFLGVRAALPALEAGGGGSIVVLTAPAGAGVSGLHQVAYASATAAVTQFVRLTAVDHAERGVRANVVVRGWVDDELLDEVPPGVDPAERRARLATRVPAGRLGRPEEVAAVVAFLADDAAHYVSGTLIPVDGGLSARAPGSDPTEA